MDLNRVCGYLSLPAELRLAVLEHVFDDTSDHDGFRNHNVPGGLLIDEKYSAADARLQILLTCRRFYYDGSHLAFSRTNFITSNLFVHIPDRLQHLNSAQVAAIRSIAFVADARHFRKFHDWTTHPFNLPQLSLDTLTVALHPSNHWHYLFDFTRDIALLLRRLRGVRRFTFIRNGALVKGSFKTWYNRLVGLMMKIDHHERYEKTEPAIEETWWSWSYDEVAQKIELRASPPKPMVDEETYIQEMLPKMEELRVSVENEEWNPDPRSRNMYY